MTTPIKYRISSTATKPVSDSVKGAPLTSLEIDGNFRSIKDSIELIQSAYLPAGYNAPVEYVAGVILSSDQQTVAYQGEVYAPKAAELPFTTSGTFEVTKFVQIQGVAGVNLAAPSGSSLVGYLPAGTGAVATTVQSKLRESVSVLDYYANGVSGAKVDPTGVVDSTAGIQACLNFCSVNGKLAFFPAGTYKVSTLTVTNGIRGIVCEGTIKGQGTAAVATLVLGSPGNPVKKAVFTLRMDQSAGDLRAMQGYDTQDCTFNDCTIYGFVDSATLNHYAFWLEGPCTGNVFSGNHITLFDTPTQRGFGIAFYGAKGTALEFGGFFAGTVSRGQFPAAGNTISNNVILNGSYAISLQFSEYNAVTANYCFNQNHRSIYLANAAWGNTISGNVLKNYLSTAVLLGYGSSNNVVSGNFCENNIVGGEAAININTGSRGNLIESNKIRSTTNYGIYIATDAINNSLIGNDIGEQYLAAIAVENDWKNPRPTNAVFSRTNYSEPPAPYTAWSFLDMTGVSIKNNVIRAGYFGRSTAAIYIAQISSAGNTKTSNVEVSGNAVVSPDNISQNVYLFEESAGLLTDLRFAGNDFHDGNAEVSASTSTLLAPWNTKISYFSSNKKLDVILAGEPITFADGDTTPSVRQNSGVSNARYFAVTNTTPTSVTQFDDGFPGQQLTVRLNNNTTIVYGSGSIRTKGLVNIVGASTNQLVGFIREANVWLETWRSF